MKHSKTILLGFAMLAAVLLLVRTPQNAFAVGGSYAISNPDQQGNIWILNTASGIASRCQPNGLDAPKCSAWSR
ncbi:MAG: hypothetical protein PVG66_04470 [Chromatiales bacterium]|jgi:hypothetical protein